MKRRIRGLALATLALLASAGALAQGSACPESVQDLPPEALYGRWEARFDGLPAVAVVQLARHPEYAGVRGTIAPTQTPLMLRPRIPRNLARRHR